MPRAHERELTRLSQHAADRAREAARIDAIENDVGNGELAGERLALGLEIDAGGQAVELAVGFDIGVLCVDGLGEAGEFDRGRRRGALVGGSGGLNHGLDRGNRHGGLAH